MMKQAIVLRCAHDLPNGFAFGNAAIAAKQVSVKPSTLAGLLDLVHTPAAVKISHQA
jgi:hypothetical protein